MLDELRSRAASAGIFLDLDGSLSPIASRPEHARPVAGAREELESLASRFRVVMVVTGRAALEARALLGAAGIRYEGVYGMESEGARIGPELRDLVVEVVKAAEPAAWVEDKGVSVGVHFRQAADPVAARAVLADALAPIAREAGLELLDGKAVLELAPPGGARKGAVVERTVRELDLSAALFAGDDVADLDAFAVLDRLAAEGLEAVKVAVRGTETPAELVESADVVVGGPEELVALLRSLSS